MHNENRFAFPFSAEKEGFEPSRRVTGLLVFEARLFSHLSTSPKKDIFLSSPAPFAKELACERYFLNLFQEGKRLRC